MFMIRLWLRNLARDLPKRAGRLAGLLLAIPSSRNEMRRAPLVNLLMSYAFDLLGGPEIAQFFMHLVTNTRPLNEDEQAAAKTVLGPGAIRFDDVRVASGGILDLVFRQNNNRAFATWHTINVPLNSQDNMPLMVHELTHVYQYERVGSIYIGQGLGVQRKMGRAAYQYGGASGLEADQAAGKRLCHYNREQQGQIAQDYCALLSENQDTTMFEPLIKELQAGLF